MQHVNMNFSSIYKLYFLYFKLFVPMYFSIFLLWKFLSSFVYVIIYCVGTEIATLMSVSNGLDPYLSVERWKRRGPWRKKWTEECLFPAKVGIFSFVNTMIKVLFPICTSIWRVNNYVSPPRKDLNRRNESTMIII